ncbi:MAG: hypothetical protein GY869_13080, partial [Planctomycetes bacterium]|nr:hypothetical protein [Planctomycetota bacterium]
MPNGIIKGQVITQLQSDFGRVVSIGEVKIGWSSGVEIFDLLILRRDRFGEGTLCQVKRIHTDFAPLDLARSIIRKITFDEPHFFVVFDDEGINIEDLPPLESEHTIVNGAVIHLVSRLGGSEQETAVFELDTAEIIVGTDKAKQTWWSVDGHQVVRGAEGGGEEQTATFSSQGQLGYDPEGELSGQVQYVNLDVDRLNLGEVKLADLYRHWGESLTEEQQGMLPDIEQLTGIFSVDTQITIEQTDKVKMNSLIELLDVEWLDSKQASSEAGQNKIDNVQVEIAGSYTLSSQQGQLEGLRVTGPGVGFRLTGEMDDVTGSIDGLNLSMEEGWIDPGILMAVAPGSALNKLLASHGFSSEGQITFDGYLNIDMDTLVNYINLDGGEWSFRTNDLVKRPGDPLSGKVQIRGNRETGELEFQSIQFEGG